jgi:hypothetical protein
VRKAAWAGFAAIGTGAVVAPTLGDGLSFSLPALARLWWTFPLAVSIASFANLLGFSVAGRFAGNRESGFSTSAYLASWPSLAGLNLLSFLSLGAAPPHWVGPAMLFLLCLSSFAYYQIIKHSDEYERSLGAGERPFASPEFQS